MCVCVLLCFIEPIVGNRGPGDSEPGDTWISLNQHLNYVAGSTGPPLPHLRTDPATNAVDNQGQESESSSPGCSVSGQVQRLVRDLEGSRRMTVKSPWLSLQSLEDFLSPDAKTYTISKPRFHQAHPHHITIAGQKNQMCMKRAWLAFPGHVQCFGARPFRESPLKHSR